MNALMVFARNRKLSVKASFANPRMRKDSGAALVMSLVILLILTILGITAMGTSSLEQKMAGNMQEATRAFEAAESGLSRAFATPGSFNLFNKQTSNFSFDSGKSGSATIVTEYIQTTPAKRGSGFSATQFDAANFDQVSTGTTITNAKVVIHQGVKLMVPKAN